MRKTRRQEARNVWKKVTLRFYYRTQVRFILIFVTKKYYIEYFLYRIKKIIMPCSRKFVVQYIDFQYFVIL